jgi:hypothetical protein
MGQHPARDQLADVERALEVQVDDGVDVLVGAQPEDAVAGDTRVVDEYVDRAVQLDRLLEGRPHGLVACDVHRYAGHVATRPAFEAPSGLVGASAVTRGQHDPVAEPRELPADLQPDAPVPAGDEGDPLLLLHQSRSFRGSVTR